MCGQLNTHNLAHIELCASDDVTAPSVPLSDCTQHVKYDVDRCVAPG